ncbi:type II toxin-antitoxin system RelE/ParE family toxin [Zoogloea sp.]|uniref:type II toxin-antitoxin system RelE/ParE family toxin n=1 Tax=Zoogloea sp. TaxID=49181 RepID=UPI001E025472|nr:type II toxin-antitoxin system RelE/ParE family toxin [Zoogloea sp.]MBK6654618.1 type II toxin-antitoxin system RelE/ParE family toxin [Zoogloea sp.]
MALPLNAKVEAAPNFLANLDAAHQFFLVQDADSADTRLTKLKADIREMIAILAWSPASGRPARFLSAKSAQATLKTNAVQQLAEQAGLPSLREYVVGQYIVLYAHSETEVVLLALKHQRQLAYSTD